VLIEQIQSVFHKTIKLRRLQPVNEVWWAKYDLLRTGTVVGQPNLVKKVVFLLNLLPLVPILSTFLVSFFGLMALIFVMVILFHTLHVTLALLPLVWITQLLVGRLGLLSGRSNSVFA
jgi:hypothetical protein